jgi:error-prone DNA polymerase
MLEPVDAARMFCNTCSHDWTADAPVLSSPAGSGRFTSVDDLVARTGLRRDELVMLATIGALNAFGYDRRSALWQAERAIRPSGELFEEGQVGQEGREGQVGQEGSACGHASGREREALGAREASASGGGAPRESNQSRGPRESNQSRGPLRPMTEAERLTADYAGTGLTTGRHPMALRRDDLAMRGVLRAIDLGRVRQARRVRVAGMVITRQRPGTAKGFVFLTLEDETGIANIIVRPDLFARDRLTIIEEPFLLIDGVLQNQEGVVSVRAERVQGLPGVDVDFDAHDFY